MKWIKWLSILAALVLIASCFFPWVIIESKNLTVTGVDVAGLRYGHYGYFLIPLCIVFIILQLVNKIWAKRLNVPVAAFILTVAFACLWIFRCEYGECPVKQAALYIVFVSSFVLFISSLFPDVKVSQPSNKLATKNAAPAAAAPITVTRNAPDHGLMAVNLLLNHPNTKKTNECDNSRIL